MVKIHIVDAFTQVVGAGNRAGVVLDAGSLSSSKMQEIAVFAGYSETAFVFPAQGDDHDVHVRYFTPKSEVPICGHATVATHFLRAQILMEHNYQVNAKTGAGILPVSVSDSGKDALVTMTQGAVEYGSTLDTKQQNDLVQGLGITKDELIGDLPVQIVSTGHSKVMIPLMSRSAIDSLEPNPEKLSKLSAEIGCNGFFPFTIDKKSTIIETYGRMFAPEIGILEDPVTGNANGPAGAYLYKYGVLPNEPELTYAGHQGHKMGKPGTTFVTVKNTHEGLIVKVSGQAVLAGERFFSD
jgi:PhzF family phenazine biosynthesis protein